MHEVCNSIIDRKNETKLSYLNSQRLNCIIYYICCICGRTEVRSSLHGECTLPTRGFRSPYTEIPFSLHGGFDFPTRENESHGDRPHHAFYLTNQGIGKRQECRFSEVLETEDVSANFYGTTKRTRSIQMKLSPEVPGRNIGPVNFTDTHNSNSFPERSEKLPARSCVVHARVSQR